MFTPLIRGTLKPGQGTIGTGRSGPGGEPIVVGKFRTNPIGKVPNPKPKNNRIPSSVALKKNLGAA